MTAKLNAPTSTQWFQLEIIFQLVGMPHCYEQVTVRSKGTPTKLYALGAKLFLSRVALEVLQK